MMNFKRYWLSIIATIVIIVLSLMPLPKFPKLADVPLWDKWVHFVMYGVLCCVYWIDYHRNGFTNKQWSKWLIWIVLIPVALGGLMEICQSTLTPNRNGDWIDFWADGIGVIIALPLGLYVIPHFLRKKKK